MNVPEQGSSSNKIKAWFFSTGLYYKFRYYFIRKKAPLSWIWWHEVLHRESSSVGMYSVSIAAAGENDGGISLSKGAPKDNNIEICLYNSKGEWFDTVEIPLSYRSMKRVMAGFDKAFAISAKQIKVEQEGSDNDK